MTNTAATETPATYKATVNKEALWSAICTATKYAGRYHSMPVHGRVTSLMYKHDTVHPVCEMLASIAVSADSGVSASSYDMLDLVLSLTSTRSHPEWLDGGRQCGNHQTYATARGAHELFKMFGKAWPAS